MQDRFKFRIWDKDKKIMISEEKPPSLMDYDQSEWWGIPEYIALTALQDVFAKDNFVLMQCTGLKDVNGKLIYENDILISPDMDEPYKIIVEWDNEKGYIIKAWNGKEFEYALSDDEIEDLKSFEIIGNIYENPELAESTE